MNNKNCTSFIAECYIYANRITCELIIIGDKQNEHFCSVLQGQTQKTQFKIGYLRNTTLFMLLVGRLEFFFFNYMTLLENIKLM